MQTTSQLRTTAATGLVLIIAMAMVVQPASAATITLLSVEADHLMSPLDEPDRFEIVEDANYYYVRVTDYQKGVVPDPDVCFYSSTGWKIDCSYAEDGWLPSGTAYIEVFLYKGLDVDYELRQYEIIR